MREALGLSRNYEYRSDEASNPLAEPNRHARYSLILHESTTSNRPTREDQRRPNKPTSRCALTSARDYPGTRYAPAASTNCAATDSSHVSANARLQRKVSRADDLATRDDHGHHEKDSAHQGPEERPPGDGRHGRNAPHDRARTKLVRAPDPTWRDRAQSGTDHILSSCGIRRRHRTAVRIDRHAIKHVRSSRGQ